MNEAAAYAEGERDRDRALEAFNYPDGSFVKDELYVFAYGMNGTALAHPFQPELVGTNRSDATDIRGTKHVRDGIAWPETVRAPGALGPNPADGHAVEPKTCYVVGMGDWYIGSGYYTARANPSVNTSAL